MKKRSLRNDILDGQFTLENWNEFNKKQKDIILYFFSHQLDILYEQNNPGQTIFDSIIDSTDTNFSSSKFGVKKYGKGADISLFQQCISKLKGYDKGTEDDADPSVLDLEEKVTSSNEQKMKTDRFFEHICSLRLNNLWDDIQMEFFTQIKLREETILKLNEFARLLRIELSDKQVAHTYHLHNEQLLKNFNDRLVKELKQLNEEKGKLKTEISELRKQRDVMLNTAAKILALNPKFKNNPLFKNISSDSPEHINAREKILKKCIEREYEKAKAQKGIHKVDLIDKEIGKINNQIIQRKQQIAIESRDETRNSTTVSSVLERKYASDPELIKYQERIVELGKEREKALKERQALEEPESFAQIFKDAGIDVETIERENPGILRETEQQIKSESQETINDMLSNFEQELSNIDKIENIDNSVQIMKRTTPDTLLNSESSNLFDDFLADIEPDPSPSPRLG